MQDTAADEVGAMTELTTYANAPSTVSAVLLMATRHMAYHYVINCVIASSPCATACRKEGGDAESSGDVGVTSSFDLQSFAVLRSYS